MGGAQSHMSILRNGNVACPFRLFYRMSLSNLRKGYVTCHHFLSPRRMSLSSMLHVKEMPMLILGVKGHKHGFTS